MHPLEPEGAALDNLAECTRTPGSLFSRSSPLVVETDGRVSPLTYGFPDTFALGDVRARRLTDLVESWDAGPFLELFANVARQLESGGAAFNWYEEINRQARRQGGVTAPTG